MDQEMAGAKFHMNVESELVPATQIQNFKMADLAPDNWFQHRSRSTVWISAFRMLKVAAGNAVNPQIIEFENSRLVFIYGSVSYYGESSASSEFVSETEMQIEASKFGPHKTPVGSYALIVTPLE